MSRHRIFIAINLSDNIKEKLSQFSYDLPLRWTRKDDLHITLIFLGYCSDQDLGKVCSIVKETAAKYSSFSMKLNKICYGPKAVIPPRMIWALGEKKEELSKLIKELEKSLGMSGGEFYPHVTLARVKTWQWRQIEPEERPEIEKDISMNFKVTSIDVMESKLKREGPQYVILEKANLIS